MRHARIERWASGTSPVHRLNPTAKLVAILIILISLSSVRHNALAACAGYLLLLLGINVAAGLPPADVLFASLTVVPFAGTFALITYFVGQREQAALQVIRTFASSYAALLLIATTPMPALIAGMRSLRVPKFLLLVMQFLYRYLVVLFEEAGAIRDAATCRGGSIRRLRLNQAGAAVGVLFARSYHRANAIHQAMLARGFDGNIPMLDQISFTLTDGIFAALIGACALAIRVIA